MKLVKYDAVKSALAAAKKVDEIRKIRDHAVAMQAYAQQAKDHEVMDDATEIRRRAERRLGEVIEAQRQTVGLSEGGRPKKTGLSKNPVSPTLADAGIDKNLAHRARRAAEMSVEEFEADLQRIQETQRRAFTKSPAEKKQRRVERERTLGEQQQAEPEAEYGVIYADPPWRFEPYNRETGMDRSADNHYPTMTIADIMDLTVPAADDCVLFLWATSAMLPEALDIMEAWDLEYKTHIIWLKDRIGTGYWARNQHELLLIGTRGDIPAPAPGEQPTSVIKAPVGKHSAKPDVFRKLIEDMFPSLPRIEMFARGAPAMGWDTWGNETEEEEAGEENLNA